jgi:hypothetical protein
MCSGLGAVTAGNRETRIAFPIVDGMVRKLEH